MSRIDRRGLLQLLGLGSLSLAAGYAGAAAADGGDCGGDGGGHGGKHDGLLNTRLVKEYGVTYPFVGAGMGFVALARPAAAITNAGGIPILGAAGPGAAAPAPLLQAQIQATKSLTSRALQRRH